MFSGSGVTGFSLSNILVAGEDRLTSLFEEEAWGSRGKVGVGCFIATPLGLAPMCPVAGVARGPQVGGGFWSFLVHT